MPDNTNPIDAARKRELGLIHIARVAVGWDKAQYVYALMERYGVDSAAGLSALQRDDFLKMFKSLGFSVKPKAKPAGSQPVREPMVRKLRAMWYTLADMGAVERPASTIACDKAIEAWGRARLASNGGVGQFDALRFATYQQLNALIEQCKRWLHRVEAEAATPAAQ
jgi:Protein of unknown function (DUF1018)